MSMYFKNPLPNLIEDHLDITKIQSGMTFNDISAWDLRWITPQNVETLASNSPLFQNYNTYVILSVDLKNNLLIAKKLIDNTGKCIFHYSKPFTMSIETFLNTYGLKKLSDTSKEIFYVSKFLKPYVFGKFYVKNEKTLNFVEELIDFLIENPLNFKQVTIKRVYRHSGFFQIIPHYEIIYHPKLSYFFKLSKSIMF